MYQTRFNIPFTGSDGEEYEVQVSTDGISFTTRRLKDGQPASRFTYSATLKKAGEMADTNGADAVAELVALAKSEVEAPFFGRIVNRQPSF